MLYFGISSNLLLTLLVLAVNNKIQAAPTHHLTIGVQGKTPTLIVTSSEIGITPQTMGSSKKLPKADHMAKGVPKKPLKSKLYKNQSLFNKKDKIQRDVKPLTKPVLTEENSFKTVKSEQLKSYENKSLMATPSETVLLSNTENTTSKREEVLQEVTRSAATFAGLLQSTTERPKPITEAEAARYNSKQSEELSLTTFQSTVHPLSTPSLPSLIPEADSLNIFSAESVALNLRDFEDTTTTPNYNDNTNAAPTSGAITENKINDVVVQTQNPTQISPDKGVIKIENGDDSNRHAHESTPATTEHGNLLLTTTDANAYVTSPSSGAISSTTSGAFITENTEPSTTAESLSLSLKTTATATYIIADDNNNNKQQLPPIKDLDKAVHGPTKEATSKDEVTDKASESQKADVLKPRHDFMYTTTTATETINKDLTTTESPLENKNSQTTRESVFNETTNEYPQNKIQSEAIATTMETIVATLTTIAAAGDEQTLTTNQKQQTATTTTATTNTYEATKTPTTETVLKLIDLEKHDVKIIGELRQPSLVTTGQHDNGHDGLKNIKKKQLVDKHFLEALLHNKQDLLENGKYSPHTAPDTKTTVTLAPNSSQYAAASGNKTILMPIKHGYLGPILMEEKTFHVVHHTDKHVTNKSHHADDIESQLRKGHFVELKVKTDVKHDKNFTEVMKNVNAKSSAKEERETLEMQSDQPDEVTNKENVQINEQKSSLKYGNKIKDSKQVSQRPVHNPSTTSDGRYISLNNEAVTSNKNWKQTNFEAKNTNNFSQSIQTILPEVEETSTEIVTTIESKTTSVPEKSSKYGPADKPATLLSPTIFETIDSEATKTPVVQANTLFTADRKEENSEPIEIGKQQTESKISDIQIEVYDSTVDSILSSTNFRDTEAKHHSSLPTQNDESYLGKTTKPPIAAIQQERFTQYVIDRTEASTPEPINYNTIRVASGKPEPAAIEIHINVSESFGNESEDVEFSYPQNEDINNKNNNNNNEKIAEESYDDGKVNENIKLKISSNSNGKELRNDEILVVEVIDNDRNETNNSFKEKSRSTDELFITDVKDIYTTLPPAPPPPPYQTNFDRDSDTIFYISNTEVKVGESLPTTKNANEERKLRLESQFFPANYMASTHPSLKSSGDLQPTHHLYEEDILLSPSRNQADSLKIYRNNNEPSPPLDVTYVGESIIEVEQSPESVITTTYAPEQQQHAATPQADVIIQPALLPEISIGVPVIGELPPQIEIKEIDFMPNEAQLHRSGIYDDNNDNNDIDENTINGSSNNNNNNDHDADVVSGNQRLDESSIQYGGDLIDESADGGFDGVEGSYPFGNPTVVGKSSSYSYSSGFLTKLRKQQPYQQQQQQQPNHVADYAHLYINYGVNNMRKDELSADVKEPGEMVLSASNGGSAGVNIPNNEQNTTALKDFLGKAGMSNSTNPFMTGNSTHSERMSNATAFSVMEDANDLEDKNTEDIVNLISLAIGLFIVILPVVVTCSMFWALRYLYKKYHSNIMDNGGYADQLETKGALSENGVEKGEFAHEPYPSPTSSYKDTIEKYQDTSNKPSTTDSNAEFLSEKSNPHLDILPCNTNTTIAYSSSAIVSKKSETLKLPLTLSSPMAQTQTKSPPSASSPLLVITTSEYRNTVHDDVVSEADDYDVELSGPNGSITKMTMENNLLIVETEERNDISRVARETKMDYNKKGVFVVEVARGIDSKAIPESPVAEGNDQLLSMFDTQQDSNGGLNYKMISEKNCMSNEKVQIHSPPSENQEEGPRSLHQIEEVDEPINSPHLNETNAANNDSVYKANTGLSQSDLSSTSSSDSNKGYCYGNQALYVVEQKDYISSRPNANVVLKCDIKDIKDDDHNPGNDHYLEHSPDKKEEINKHKEDAVKTSNTSQEGESRTNSGESPEQKQNEKEKEILENSPQLQEKREHDAQVLEQHATCEHLRNCEKQTETNLPREARALKDNFQETQNVCIPVQIEVHITPAQDESCAEDTILSSNKSTLTQDSSDREEIENTTATPEVNSKNETLEHSAADEEEVEISSIEKEQVNDTTDEIEVSVVPHEFVDDEASQDAASKINMLPPEKYGEERHKTVAKLERIEEKTLLETAEANENQLENGNEEEPNLSLLNGFEGINSMDNIKRETDKQEPATLIENGLLQKKKKEIYLNGSATIERDEAAEEDIKYSYAAAQTKLLTNGSSTVSDQEQTQQLENGHADIENNCDSLSEIENGYDSILSLPEPPPTTDEQQSDLSEQQLDSLPPPPPPEIFNLKTLPPPLTNGNADFPQSEESSCFYNLLPPPPPTTLEVNTTTETAAATNGKVHASPLTPPASPPAHFTNNLHAGLCSQPIAVDVNGS